MTRILSLLLFAGFFIAAPAFAQDLPATYAHPWEIGFQNAGSLTAERMDAFHHFMLYIITAIVIFVLALLIWVIVRYNSHMNPAPSQTAHNVLLEIVWTVIPILILIVVAVPSMQLLYYTDRTKNPEMTLKVTGYQWYWGYEYPDNGGVNFTAYMIPEKDIDKSKGQVRLLSSDNPVVLPVNTNIRIWTTAADVIHSWAVPSLGVKMDAMPGHLNETWVNITKPGIYYGQCSELCGKDHAFMPIEVHAVSKEDFQKWVQSMKESDKPADKKEEAKTPEKAPAK